MQKILLTGANGFVGKHLLDQLSSYFVIGLTHQGDLKESENRKFHNGNILDSGFLQDIIIKYLPDVVFHLAAIAPTHYKDSEQVFKINLMGTNNLYQAIVSAQNSLPNFNPKVIYISSAEVYGKTNHPESIDESCELNPVNYYASSKLASDRLTFQMSQSHNLNAIILRPFNHTGPGQLKGFFVPDMASQIVEIENDKDKNQILVGNLDSIRDISDVRDIAQAYKLVIEKNDITPGEVFNVCSGKGKRMIDVLTKLLSFAKKPIQTKPDPERLRPSDNPVVVGQNSKFVKFFNWQIAYDFDQTLKDTLEFWRNNTP